jgi:hypothetical protein
MFCPTQAQVMVGYPIVLRRLDDIRVASVTVGIGGKARTAIFRRLSKVFEDQAREGRVAASRPRQRSSPRPRESDPPSTWPK